MEREFKNAKKLVKKLHQLRSEKILNDTKEGKAISKDRLTKEEEKVYAGIAPSAESYQALLKEVTRGRSPHVKPEKKTKKRIVVRFVQEIPAIVGSDMKTYGPFKPEDIATLPIENAKALIKQEAAEEVEAKS